eukprot:5337078-Pyramimonas_sp.AAC.1
MQALAHVQGQQGAICRRAWLVRGPKPPTRCHLAALGWREGTSARLRGWLAALHALGAVAWRREAL